MTGNFDDLADPERRLCEILAAYFEAAKAGQAPERGAWLARYPNLADQLIAFLEEEHRLLSMTEPLRTIPLERTSSFLGKIVGMEKESGLPVCWQIGHDSPSYFFSSHKEATTTMVAEGPKPKKTIRPAADAAGFSALVALGRLVGARSSRTYRGRFRRWAGSDHLGGNLFGGWIFGPPARPRAQDRPVRV